MTDASTPSTPRALGTAVSRRRLIEAAVGSATVLAAGHARGATMPVPADRYHLPARSAFGDIGIFLNAAATHPLPHDALNAGTAMLASRADRAGGHAPPRPPLRDQLAALINATPDEIAFVPSTGIAEVMVGDALGLGPGRGVVTDGLHFDGALAMYAQRARRGMPLVVARPVDGRVPLDAIVAAITPETRLIAVAEISNFNGFRHDLGALCDMAHARGVLVFADVIQSAGAVPVDVRATGVDFCAASCYKWMMGDLGSAFLYVRKDVQDRLGRSLVGWNELDDAAIMGQRTAFDPAISADTFQFRTGAAGLFEPAQQSIVNTAIVGASLRFIRDLGVARIAAHRDALRAYARDRFATLPGVVSITPNDGLSTTIEAFALKGAAARLSAALDRATITVGLYENRIRISPSVYNTNSDIDTLVDTIRAAL